MINDYKNQAAVWDWDGFDDSAEFEYWSNYAENYGKNILIPMCAHGKIGAYMAQKGFKVAAFDNTPEMIAEGKKRHGFIKNLDLIVDDLLDLKLDKTDFDFAFIAGFGDLHLLQSMLEVEKAFYCLNKHLRRGGCLVLEFSLPPKQSQVFEKKVFYPRVNNYSDKIVWKENEGRYDAAEKRRYINQTVFIKSGENTESFTQNLILHFFSREEIVKALLANGFVVKNEYINRNKQLFNPQKSGLLENELIIEAIKI